MWKLLEISQQTYFIYCNFNIRDVTFILYDLKSTWSQTLALQDVKQKVKLLNRRFDFNDDNIKEALSSDAIHSVVIEEAINMQSRVLKLKYRVKNCFLNYEWTLKKENFLQFQQTIVQPLLLALLGCHQQIEILTESIRKKDIELKQFRLEGAVLNRKTLVTKPFDFANFNKKYEDCNQTAINFRELAKYVKENESKKEPETTTKNLHANKTEENVNPKEILNYDRNTNKKMSPRNRKRKVNEFKMQHLEQHLKVRKQGLEYESSQSQTPSSGSSQTVQEAGINDLRQQQSSLKQKEKSKVQNTSLPRKNSRCKTMQQKEESMSSDDKTDSGNESFLRTLRERKATTSRVDLPKDSSNENEEQALNTNRKYNNTGETMRKCKKSLNLSYSSQKNSPKKSLETSNVFDFSTDSEDNIPVTENKNLLENKREYNKHLPRRMQLLAKESLTLPFSEDCGSNRTPVHDKFSPSQGIDLNNSTAPVINEISSQLDNIKKELESLEAMRLADLKQRMCKT